MATKTLPPHGTLSRAKYHKCKCTECLERCRLYQRSRYRKQGYGTWQPLIDAAPVRQHLLKLNAAGLSYAVIAKRLGCSTANVTRFIYDLGPSHPRRKRTRPELAARILAITVTDLTPGLIDATGAARRIQALAANGWPLRSLGPHIGVNPASVGRIAYQQYVFRDTVKAVADCYEKLRDQRPEDHGIDPGSALKTRNRARREGWPDPLWWDDMGHIDDPDFDPAEAERELNRDELNRDELAAYRRKEIAHLASYGIPEHEIAARLDMSPQYVHDLIRDRLSTAA